MRAGVEAANVVARLTCTDGESTAFNGIKVISPFGSSEWGMIRSDDADITRALVVRERDILKVQFELEPHRVDKIGFFGGDTAKPD